MFVSRKCLAALIHFFPRELSTGIHMAQLIHQGAIFLLSNLTTCDPFQPVAEELMQRSVLTASFLPGQFDVGLIGVECNVLSHGYSVHETRVICKVESYPIQDEPEGEVRFQYKMSLERMAC